MALSDKALKASGLADWKKMSVADREAADNRVQEASRTLPGRSTIMFVTASDLGISEPKTNPIPLTIISALDPIRGDLIKSKTDQMKRLIFLILGSLTTRAFGRRRDRIPQLSLLQDVAFTAGGDMHPGFTPRRFDPR